jgi:predicted dehydrogenase
MKALVVGLGSIGRRHLANLAAIVPQIRITACHLHSQDRVAGTGAGTIENEVFSIEGALSAQADIALITSPASCHVEVALALAEQGVHLFVEKPLSDSLSGVDELIEVCAKKQLVLMVGYNLRFYQPFQVLQKALSDGRIGKPLSIRGEVGQYLPDWRPTQDYRKGVTAQKILGGGVLLELSHEFDYFTWLMGEAAGVFALVDKLSDLDIDVEDIAEVVIRFKNGALGNVHLDMLQRAAVRNCRIIGSEGILHWEWQSHSIRLFEAGGKEWTYLQPPQELETNQIYVEEMRHFLKCVQLQERPLVGGREGRQALAIALGAKRSALENRFVSL